MQSLLFLYIIIIFSSVIHEYFHAWTANRLGDPTARIAGRLTLNPLKHMDMWGTVILPLFLMTFFKIFIGYAKPVPFNPYNIRYKHGVLLVGLAGPVANLSVAVILGLLLRFVVFSVPFAIMLSPLIALIVYINIFLALFNMIPVPPLDGSKVIPEILPYRLRGAMQDAPAGIFLAIIIAFWILPTLARYMFIIIVGRPFLIL